MITSENKPKLAGYIRKALEKEGINPDSLSKKQLDELEAISGNLKKGNNLANSISSFGVMMEIGALIYILLGAFLLEWSKILAGVTGGLFGLLLTYIGFRIQHRASLKKLLEEYYKTVN